MLIAVEGCAHGELEIIYDTIQVLEERDGVKVDLLICCGDFQATRNEEDLYCMAIPPKYYNMCSFYKYYNGEKTAPILTVFVGGNHEASNHLQELPYGGWVAPNIYYLGYAGVINVAGVRIGGISGIYKGHDYMKGRYEKSPYDNGTIRSVYHVRNLEVFRLKQISQPVDIFVSHDWPADIWKHGNFKQLLRFKPFFQNDMDTGKLGSRPCKELLEHIQPKYWFSAHLHCKFVALVKHPNSEKTTKFLALDKCLPKRRFLQITEIPHDPDLKIELSYDLEWLTVLNLTNHLLSVKALHNYMPGPNGIERWQFNPTDKEKLKISSKFLDGLTIPCNFVKTLEGYDPQSSVRKHLEQPLPQINPQTQTLCCHLEIDDPLVLLDAFSKGRCETEGHHEDSSTSGNESSEVFETFVKSNSTTRISLTLPEPKNDSLNAILDESELDSTNKEEEKVVIVAESPKFEEQCKNDGAKEEFNEESPVIKRFKRRNANIYQNQDDT